MEARLVVTHLMRGCAVCAEALRSRARAIAAAEPDLFADDPDLDDLAAAFAEDYEIGLQPIAAPPASLGEENEMVELTAEQDAAYDLALERALSSVRLHGEQAVARKRQAESVMARIAAEGPGAASAEKDGAYPVYEAMLAQSWAARHDDPAKMVDDARQAVRLSGSLEQEGFTPRHAADLQARALGELANALRVADRLPEASATLEQAESRSRSGSGDPILSLRLADLRASLLISTHHYHDAVELLERVQADHLELGDRHNAGRALISQGISLGYLGDAREALARIDRGLSMIDEKREPSLRAQALHNQLLFMASFGLLDQAVALLAQNRVALQQSGGRLDRAKLRDIEGRIHARLGNFARAEEALREAAAEFEATGVEGNHAVVCLDLAAVLLAEGRNAEAQALAAQALQVFRALDLQEEVYEAMEILERVLRSELVTSGFLQNLADFVRRARVNPGLRFLPGFDPA